MIRPPTPPPQKPLQRSRAPLLWLVLGAGGILAALAAGGTYLAMHDRAGMPGWTEARLGPARLIFSTDYARFASERLGGDMEQIDLAAQFPDFRAAGEIKGLTPGSDLTIRSENIVFLTLTPAGRGLDPSERMAKLYARFLEPEEWSHPGGLVMRRFVPGSPFDKEDLYLTPPEGKAFTARCLRPAPVPDGLPDACIHDLRLGSLNVQLRFSPARLVDWEALTQGARQLVTRMLR